MKKNLRLVGIIAIAMIFNACATNQTPEITSPDGRLQASVFLLDNGQVAYTVTYDGSPVIETSTHGFEYLDMPTLSEELEIRRVKHRSFHETWEMPWDEQRFVSNTWKGYAISCPCKETV